MKTLMLAGLLVLAGCATTGGSAGVPPVDVRGAEIAKRVMDNGDTLEEYRVAGQLRMVKVTPSRGAPYYMYEGSQTGGVDRSKDGVSPVYWKLYSW